MDVTEAPQVRSLLVCPALPATVRGGNDVRNRSLLAALATVGPTGVVGLRHDPATRPPDGLPVSWWATAGDPALTAPRLNGQGTAWMASPGAHPADEWCTPEALEGVRRIVAEVRPSMVIASEATTWAFVDACRDLADRVILDLPSIVSQILDEISAVEPTAAARMARRMLARRTADLEVRAAQAADAVWACSAVDRAVILAAVPGVPVAVVPNVVDLPDPPPEPARDPLLLYPALFSFPPNDRAARRLVADIFPKVRAEVPEARLALVGSGVRPPLAELAAATPGVELVGPVPTMAPWFDRASVVPVPLEEGSGTRVKILEALARARPVITTPKGREGLDLVPGREVVDAVDDDQFVAGIVALLGDPARAAALGRAGRAAVLARHSPAVLAGRVRAALRAP